MHEPFIPAWWLPEGHSQTLWGKFFRRRHDVPWIVERIPTPDDDFLDIYRLPAPPTAPRIVLLHGLEGGPSSGFVTALADSARRSSWGFDVVVNRGCGGEINLAPRYYFAGDSADFSTALAHVGRTHPRSPLLLCGISLGGNVLLKWLGELGASFPRAVLAAAAVSVPFDLARSCRRIDSGVSRIYSRNFLSTMKPKALAKIEQYPGIASPEAVGHASSIWALDDSFTSIVHGYRDAADYYARCSSLQFLDRIRCPTLLLSARDDPFHPPEVLDEVRQVASVNRMLTLDFPDKGGHVGFVSGRWPWRTADYAKARVFSFLSQHSPASISELGRESRRALAATPCEWSSAGRP